MKKNTKILIRVLSLILCCMFLFTGCGSESESGEVIDGDNVSGSFKIRLLEEGFKRKWLDNVISGFNAKYPNVKIKVYSSPEKDVVLSEARANSSNYDMYFVESSLTDYTLSDNVPFVSLDDVFDYKWEGEDRTIGEKIYPLLYENYLTNGHRYLISSFISSYGLVYNATTLAQLGYDDSSKMPVTTEELKAMCNDIKGSIQPITVSGDDIASYWYFMYNTWFAQYQTRKEFNLSGEGKILKGDGTTEVSVKSASLDGSLKAMQVCEDLLWLSNGFINSKDIPTSFVQIQKNFLSGKAAMMVNGSWMMNEMNDLFPDGFDYDFKFMKTPIISAIVERCTTIENDKELASLIRAIDNGSTSLKGAGYDVNQADFDRISEARSFNYMSSQDASIVIVKSSKAQTLAKLFLKYMYSDEGIKLHAKAGAGNVLPVTGYDFDKVIKADDSFMMSFLDMIQFYKPFYADLNKMAINPYCAAEGMNIEKQFGSSNVNDRVKAVDSFNAKKNKYEANEGKAFFDELRKMGYKLS